MCSMLALMRNLFERSAHIWVSLWLQWALGLIISTSVSSSSSANGTRLERSPEALLNYNLNLPLAIIQTLP